MSANNLTALYPTSYLEAVNELLAAIGEAPVNSIGTGLSESRLAQLTLDRVSVVFKSVVGGSTLRRCSSSQTLKARLSYRATPCLSRRNLDVTHTVTTSSTTS